MDNGWIKLHRKLLENPFAHKANSMALWVTLLLLANHKENKFMWNGKILIIKEGQFITGRKELSKQTGIPATTIERILETLENGHQIGQQKTTKYRLITIVNWESHQNVDRKVDNKRTTNGQQTDTNNKGENEKNERNNIADKNPPLPVKEIKKTNDDVPMNLEEFREWTRSSPQRHIQVIGEWAGAEELTYTTKAQWTVLIKRNLRPAKELISYSEDQLQNAYTKMLKDVKHKDKNTGKEVGFLSKYTLETLVKYI